VLAELSRQDQRPGGSPGREEAPGYSTVYRWVGMHARFGVFNGRFGEVAAGGTYAAYEAFSRTRVSEPAVALRAEATG